MLAQPKGGRKTRPALDVAEKNRTEGPRMNLRLKFAAATLAAAVIAGPAAIAPGPAAYAALPAPVADAARAPVPKCGLGRHRRREERLYHHQSSCGRERQRNHHHLARQSKLYRQG